MILGLPPASWLLIVVSVGCGLALEILYLRARSRDAGPPDPLGRRVEGEPPDLPPDDGPPPTPAGSPVGAPGS